MTSLDISKNFTLAHLKQNLKIVSEIIKSLSTALTIKMIRNYQKNFGKSKSAMQHQNSHGKLSEYAVLTAFYVQMRNTKLQHTKETDNLLNKRTEIINT